MQKPILLLSNSLQLTSFLYKLGIYASMLLPFGVRSQFSPPASQPGSIAISANDSRIIYWANSCKVIRGYRDIAAPDSGLASTGADSMATGPALQNGVVSLGDKGSAILTFPQKISNKPGYDFAIFENSFLDSFLELAFVEVSSDGNKYVQFPATSLTDTSTQIPSFGFINCRKINNLAGSFRAGYGTPFDLEELKDSQGIDINNINYIKLVDVGGSLQKQFRSLDAGGRPINDPWPTNFPSSGFDLDAIGVLGNSLTISSSATPSLIKIYPNPITQSQVLLNLSIPANTQLQSVHCYTINGVQQPISLNGSQLILPSLNKGLYYLKFQLKNFTQTQVLVVR